MYLAYLLDILFFRLEFTQDLSQFEHSKCQIIWLEVPHLLFSDQGPFGFQM